MNKPLVRREEVDGELYGYSFFCPGCKRTHVIPTSANANQRWDFNHNLEAPTFIPSLLVKYTHHDGYDNDNPAPFGYDGPMKTDVCHSFIRDGKIQFLGDCTHELAGTTVQMKEVSGNAE